MKFSEGSRRRGPSKPTSHARRAFHSCQSCCVDRGGYLRPTALLWKKFVVQDDKMRGSPRSKSFLNAMGHCSGDESDGAVRRRHIALFWAALIGDPTGLELSGHGRCMRFT